MSRIIIVDLAEESVKELNKGPSESMHYGRGLALQLLKSYKDALVFVPGLLTGNKIPCATRAVVMARGEGKKGLLVSNFTGNFPQKLASLNISAIVIKGKSKRKNMCLLANPREISLLELGELEQMDTFEMVDTVRMKFGKDSAMWGVGKAADLQLPIATFFSTYPEGTPKFSCPRNGFGAVAGAKGFRGIIVQANSYFGADAFDEKGLQENGKVLAKKIIQDPICGGALPGLGSMTLLHLLKNKEKLPAIPEKASKQQNVLTGKINTCCAPMCVIGCLNRHSLHSGDVFGAPAEAEVKSALNHCFGEASVAFAKQLNTKGFSIGIDTVEFVKTVAIYFATLKRKPSQEEIMSMLDEVKRGTVLGRILGGGTMRVAELYKEEEEIQKMVTKPAVSREQDVKVKMKHFSKETNELSDLELLYQQVYILENLGICIFSSFAILNDQETLELLAKIASAKTGEDISLQNLLDYAGQCMNEELSFSREISCSEIQKSIPEFIKVLYSCFE